ncbi:MAG TPA: ATP-binding protein [Patescibacteria group bacterium]|nr:ATP-binding protein [Patescibacteria group bacterium]
MPALSLPILFILSILAWVGFLFILYILYNEEKRHYLTRSSWLMDFCTTISSFEDHDALGDYVCQELTHLGFSHVFLALRLKEGTGARGKASSGFPPQFDPKKLHIPLKPARGMLAKTIAKGEFLSSDDEETHTIEYLTIEPHSYASIPLLPKKQKEKARQAWGVLFVAKEKGYISGDEKKMLQSIGFELGTLFEKDAYIASLQQEEGEMKRRIYEVSILKELGERIGYELNVQKIVDIIGGSLGELLEYSTVSSVLFTPEGKTVFHSILAEPVSRIFIQEVKQRMIESINALSGSEIKSQQVQDTLTGAIIDDTNTAPVSSFFNIPLMINNRIVGVMTVASTKPGLYHEEEMTILYKIVSQAANAVSKLERVLEAEKGKLTAMVSSMADGVIMVDKHTVLQVFNPAARRMLQLEGQEASIFDVFEKVHGKIHLRRKMEEAMSKEQLIVLPDTFLAPTVAVRVLISPVYDEQKNPLGTVVLLHDVTKEKELERVREDFTAMMVHELRAPLTAIYGSSDILLQHVNALQVKEQQELLSVVKMEAQSMIKLVSDLLDVAKIETGHFMVIKQKQPFLLVIEDQLRVFEGSAKEKNIDLRREFDDSIPEVAFDKMRLAQVLANLLSNAIKYTNKGGIVTVSAAKKKDTVVIAIRDTGIGMSEEQVKNLFNKFQQFQARGTEGEKGTGLGLVIAKGIIQAHGGELRVESEENVGSIFYISLPISDTKA